MSAAGPAKRPQTPEAGQKSPSVAHSPGNGHCCPTPPPHWTDNPDHPLHIAAKAKRCPLCRAEPGHPCQNVARRPLYGDRLHNARTEAP